MTPEEAQADLVKAKAELSTAWSGLVAKVKAKPYLAIALAVVVVVLLIAVF